MLAKLQNIKLSTLPPSKLNNKMHYGTVVTIAYNIALV